MLQRCSDNCPHDNLSKVDFETNILVSECCRDHDGCNGHVGDRMPLETAASSAPPSPSPSSSSSKSTIRILIVFASIHYAFVDK